MRGASRAILVVTAALLVALGFSSCKPRGEPPLALRKVLIDVAPGADAGGMLEREVVRDIVERFIADDPRFSRTDDRDAAVLRVRLESTALMAPDRGKGPGGTLSLSVEVSGGAPGEPQKRQEYRGHSMASLSAEVAGERSIDFRALVRRAFEDAASQVLIARAAHRKESAVLLAWIDDERAPAEQRYQAVRILGARKDLSAVPSLIRALASADRNLAQAALGALTLIGDPSAAEAVIAYAEGKPSLIRKQAIEAIRVMGSPLGRAWLFTLSTGHPDADVRVAAERALAEIEQRPVDLAATQLAGRGEEDAPNAATP